MKWILAVLLATFAMSAVADKSVQEAIRVRMGLTSLRITAAIPMAGGTTIGLLKEIRIPIRAKKGMWILMLPSGLRAHSGRGIDSDSLAPQK